MSSLFRRSSGGLAALLATALLPGCRPSPARAPNVVLITIDTLRADHLSCYGYSKPTSPHLDQLARQGVRFADALAQAPWTLPSMASIHTGLYPSQHGAVGETKGLSDEVDTLAEALRNEGYRTLAVVSHVFVERRYGFEQGFDAFRQIKHGVQSSTADAITSTALELVQQDHAEPFFLWVHYFDPHNDYLRHAEFGLAGKNPRGHPAALSLEFLQERKDVLDEEYLQYLLGVYDEEIAYTDRAIGLLLEGLNELDNELPFLRVLTADHGEYFMDRGRLGHGKDLYRELVHVPLIVSGAIEPNLQGTVRQETVEISSVAHTILALVGARTRLPGKDLLEPGLAGEPQVCFTEGSHAWGEDQRKIAVVSDHWKLIRHLDDDRIELYSLIDDPFEERDLSQETSPTVLEEKARLLAHLEEFVWESLPAEEIELEESELEHLRELGYAE